MAREIGRPIVVTSPERSDVLPDEDGDEPDLQQAVYRAVEDLSSVERGDILILSNLCIEVFSTESFSFSVQSFFNASSIAAVCSGVVSLYKYNKRSSGVKFVISNPLMSLNFLSLKE